MTQQTTSPLLVALRNDHGGPSARLERRLRTSLDQAWAAITDPERISRWLAPTVVDDHGAGEAQRYTVSFDHGGVTSGSVIACRAPDYLEVTWEIPGERPSTVAVDLREDGDEVVLVLDHRQLPPSMARGYAAGWHAYAERLDAEVTGGDAPDWDEIFSAVLPAYTEANPTADLEPTGYVLGRAERPVIVLERLLDATPAEVWSAWTEPERLARWWGAVDRPLMGVGSVVRMAMTATELPEDPATAENPATFTVRESTVPTDGSDGWLVFTFDDKSDPGGLVTLTMTAEGDRCRLVLQHAPLASPRAMEHASSFGAGWDGFLVWLEAELAGHERPAVDQYEALLPYYARQRDRAARSEGSVVQNGVVRHRRTVAASPAAVWALLTTPRGLSGWLGELIEGQPGPGATFVVRHDPQDPSQTQTSEVTVWEPERRLAITWAFDDEPQSEVEFVLTETGVGTELTLTHRGVEADAGSYATGWQAHLDLLGALAEGDAPPPFAYAYQAAKAV